MVKVITIDDDEKLTEVIKGYLEEHSLDVKIINEGDKAMSAIKNFDPDLILLDIVMPNKDGIELLKEIKNNPMTSFIPVIMLTGQSSSHSEIDALTLGADDYITKPFDMNVLYARITSIQRRLAQETRNKYNQINLLRYLIKTYSKRDYKIYTKLLDKYPSHPEGWNKYIPDLIIEKKNKIRMFNFETSQTILEESFIERANNLEKITNVFEKKSQGNIIVRNKKVGKKVKDILEENYIDLNIKLIKKHKRGK